MRIKHPLRVTLWLVLVSSMPMIASLVPQVWVGKAEAEELVVIAAEVYKCDKESKRIMAVLEAQVREIDRANTPTVPNNRHNKFDLMSQCAEKSKQLADSLSFLRAAKYEMERQQIRPAGGEPIEYNNDIEARMEALKRESPDHPALKGNVLHMHISAAGEKRCTFVVTPRKGWSSVWSPPQILTTRVVEVGKGSDVCEYKLHVPSSSREYMITAILNGREVKSRTIDIERAGESVNLDDPAQIEQPKPLDSSRSPRNEAPPRETLTPSDDDSRDRNRGFFRFSGFIALGLGAQVFREPLEFLPADPDSLVVTPKGGQISKIPLCAGGGHCVYQASGKLTEYAASEVHRFSGILEGSFVVDSQEVGVTGGVVYDYQGALQGYLGLRFAGTKRSLRLAMAPLIGATIYSRKAIEKRVHFSEPSYGDLTSESGVYVEARSALQFGLRLDAEYVLPATLAMGFPVSFGVRPAIFWDGDRHWAFVVPFGFSFGFDLFRDESREVKK